MTALTAISIGLMFGIGVFQILRRNVIRSAMGLVIISNAINLFLLSAGAYNGLIPAYANMVGVRSDALPQALILTAIVISMGGFAFVLGLLYIVSVRYKAADIEEVSELKH
jgi:multicomponent Na+:H+ antiporter subunit C